MPQSDSPIYNLTLILLTGESAPAGPGWYITGQAQNQSTGSNIPLRRVSVPDAEEIARTFEGLIPTNQADVTGGLRPFQLVREGTPGLRRPSRQSFPVLSRSPLRCRSFARRSES